MLKKESRLTRVEIQNLKSSSKQNKVLQGNFFGLVYQKTDQPGKFGLIISNKVVAKAVERNKIKRLLYSAIYNDLDSLKGLFLFLAKKNCVNGKLEEFEREMENFFYGQDKKTNRT